MPHFFPQNARVPEHVKTILIVYHSLTGAARQMAEAAARGARESEIVDVVLKRAPDALVEDVLAADGFIFATPENLAAMSGMLKDFFDRTYYGALDRLSGRPYLILIAAGSDGSNAVRQIERVLTGWRLKAVAEPFIVCTHASSPEQILKPKTLGPDVLRHCEDLGKTLAAGLGLGIF